MTDGGAQADLGIYCDYIENPLWITEVRTLDFFYADNQTIVTDDEAVYTEPGAPSGFYLQVENRVPENYEELYAEDMSNELSVTVQYLPDAEHASNAPTTVLDYEKPLSCATTDSSRSIQPGETCILYGLDLPGDGTVQEPSNADGGEQRIRFLVHDEDANADFSNSGNCGTDGACIGAERILTVNRRPDFTIDAINPTDGPPTTSYGNDEISFDVTLNNEGDYPDWNPNGGRGHDQFAGRSSYDGDADNYPDERAAHGDDAYDSKDASDDAPPCRWLDDPEGYPCSYRRGAALPTTITYEARPDGADDPDEEGQHLLYDMNDEHVFINKDNPALIHNQTTHTETFDAVSLYKRAGVIHVTMGVGLDETGIEMPDHNETNDEEEQSVDVLGVDLELTDHGIVVVPKEGGGTATDCPQSDPCPVNSEIHLKPAFRNTGNDDTQHDINLDRAWNAAVFVNGQRQETLVEEFDAVPSVDDGKQDIYDATRIIEPDDGGGNHSIVIRLDHEDNYDSAPDHPNGRIGERTENHNCPDAIKNADNTFCLNLTFEDLNPPNFETTTIHTQSPNGDIVEIIEGEQVTFEATLTDGINRPDRSLSKVTALFEDTDGNAVTFTGPDGEPFSQVELTRSEEDGTIWNVTTQLYGNLTQDTELAYVYKVQAEDLNHTVVSEGLEFAPAMTDPAVESVFVQQIAPGQHTVTTEITNRGEQRTDALDLQVEACPIDLVAWASSTGYCQGLFQGDISRLDPAEAQGYDIHWDTWYEAGEWEVCSEVSMSNAADADPANDERCTRVFVGI